MAASSRRAPNLSVLGGIAFSVIVLISYVLRFIGAPLPVNPLETALLLALGVAYTAIGTFGVHRAEQSGRFSLRIAYFAIELILAAAIVLLSRSPGDMWLLPLPLVSQAVMALPRRWLVVVCLLALVILEIPFAQAMGGSQIVQSAATFSAAVGFVVLFSQIAVNERNAHTEVERLAGDLSDANRRLRAYAVQAEDLATMQERNRLARDIHDGLGHYLTVINIQMEAARAVMESDPAHAGSAIAKAQTLTQQALDDVRRSVAALRATPTEGRPLLQAISQLVEEHRSAGILTELTIAGEPRPLSPQADMTLYRAVQEALTNVRKHARASRTDVRLDFRRPDAIKLTVQDNGVGSDVGSGDTGAGFGLLGLTERVQLLGGQVHLRTAPRQGFTLEVEVPG
jgi:signal transduction histidine kinase